MLVSLVRFQSSAPLLNFARWGPFDIPHLAARSRSPSATSLRRSLAAAGADVIIFARWGPVDIPHLAARSRSPSATSLRRSLAAAGAAVIIFARWGPLTFPTSLRARGRLR